MSLILLILVSKEPNRHDDRRVKSASSSRQRCSSRMSLFHPTDATTATILKKKQRNSLPQTKKDANLDEDKKYYLRFNVGNKNSDLSVEEKSF